MKQANLTETREVSLDCTAKDFSEEGTFNLRSPLRSYWNPTALIVLFLIHILLVQFHPSKYSLLEGKNSLFSI